MTKRDYTECDICGERITQTLRARFRRKWRFHLLDWGMTDITPASSGWRRKRFDLCRDCWRELLATVKERVE